MESMVCHQRVLIVFVDVNYVPGCSFDIFNCVYFIISKVPIMYMFDLNVDSKI